MTVSPQATLSRLAHNPSSALHVQHAVELQPFNTMALSCIADTLITVYDEAQLKSVVQDLPAITTDGAYNALFILSGGSNVLLPPYLHATVLRPLLKGIKVIKETASAVCIEVGAGENWHDLVVKAVNNGCYGLENLALIPGLTGAAPIQNIGAYGVQLEDCLTHIYALHLPSKRWHKFDKKSCEFGYRDSLFKQQIGDWLITKVGFRLHKDNTKTNANYGDVQSKAQALAAKHGRDTITPSDVMTAIIDLRQSKLPDPNLLPNCGSFFKNPVIPTAQFNALKSSYPNIVGYPQGEHTTKVAAGWLIDNAGLKGGGIAPILTHDTQALVLTNHGNSARHQHTQAVTQADVATSQAYIQRAILAKYHIKLEREPMWIDSDGTVNMTNVNMTNVNMTNTVI